MSKLDPVKKELKLILSSMNVPEEHKGDILWLATRLGNRNPGHPNLARAEDLIYVLLRNNVTTL